MAMTDERKLLLLGLLRQANMHGYMLNAHLGTTTPISLKKPTAYNLLERMEQDGWVTHRDEPTGDRPRRVYSVTAHGEQMFQDLLRQQLGSFTPAEFPGLVSVGFLDTISAPEAIECLKRRRATIEEFRGSFNVEQGDSSASDEMHHGGSTFLMIEYTRRYLDLEIQFLNEVIGELESI